MVDPFDIDCEIFNWEIEFLCLNNLELILRTKLKNPQILVFNKKRSSII